MDETLVTYFEKRPAVNLPIVIIPRRQVDDVCHLALVFGQVHAIHAFALYLNINIDAYTEEQNASNWQVEEV